MESTGVISVDSAAEMPGNNQNTSSTMVSHQNENREENASERKENKSADTQDYIALTFPQKLMQMLNDETNNDILTWLPNGKAFMIYKKKKFATQVLPKYFKRTLFTSFTRKLNRWGFQRVTRGPEAGSYFHRMFQRDDPNLCLQMNCNSGGMPINIPPPAPTMALNMGMGMLPTTMMTPSQLNQLLTLQRMQIQQLQQKQQLQAELIRSYHQQQQTGATSLGSSATNAFANPADLYSLYLQQLYGGGKGSMTSTVPAIPMPSLVATSPPKEAPALDVNHPDESLESRSLQVKRASAA